MAQELGKRVTVWIPRNLDKIVETARQSMGLNRSSFYRTAVLRYLEGISAIPTQKGG